MQSEIRDLSTLLDVVEGEVAQLPGRASVRRYPRRDRRGRSVSVAALMRAIGPEAHGPLLLAVGLISISPATLVPGSTWALAGLTLLIALQIGLQRARPWVPRHALRIRVQQDTLAGFIRAARPAAAAVDRLVKPRWQFFTEPPWVMVIALLCALAALITFPLGLIPFAPFAPGLAIVLFGLGLTARDGVLLAAGAATLTVALWFVFSSLI
jgi:hypothetical protein